jgi:glutathione peroxidase-family protein
MGGHDNDEGGTVADFHEFEMDSITGDPVAFSDYEGQVCLVVNVATY